MIRMMMDPKVKKNARKKILKILKTVTNRDAEAMVNLLTCNLRNEVAVAREKSPVNLSLKDQRKEAFLREIDLISLRDWEKILFKELEKELS